MALNDQQIQYLQSQVKDYSTNGKSKIEDFETGQYYKVINRTPGDPNSKDVTQAIAVAPIDSSGNVDYSQTAIIVAGTQPENPASFGNAVKAAWDPTSSLTAQTQDVRNFYQSTMKKLADKPNGYISNMSGFSQSGPAVAKVASEQKVPHITNFDDWASVGATNPYILGIVKNFPHEYLTPSDIAYLNKRARIYMASSKDLRIADGGAGNIPYGKVMVVEGTPGLNNPIGDHDTQFSEIKGNGLNIDWYIKNNRFCSGMTYAQVVKVAKAKAKKAKSASFDPHSWFDSTDYQTYVDEYVKIYGAFASENPANQKLKEFDVDIKDIKGQLKSASGGKAISLRSDLVKSVAQKASLQAEVYVSEVKQLVDNEKTVLEGQIQAVRQQAYSLGRHLSAWEIEGLLSNFSMSSCWDTNIEATILTELAAYQEKLVVFSEKVSAAADKIVAIDKENAQLFH
jgi:hypothetical protein